MYGNQDTVNFGGLSWGYVTGSNFTVCSWETEF